jgi:hypothetical protein
LDACADVLGVATSPGRARGKIASTVVGLAWTEGQQEELRTANIRVAKEREAFIKVVRQELGAEEIVLPLEQANQPDLSGKGPGQRAGTPELGPED